MTIEVLRRPAGAARRSRLDAAVLAGRRCLLGAGDAEAARGRLLRALEEEPDAAAGARRAASGLLEALVLLAADPGDWARLEALAGEEGAGATEAALLLLPGGTSPEERAATAVDRLRRAAAEELRRGAWSSAEQRLEEAGRLVGAGTLSAAEIELDLAELAALRGERSAVRERIDAAWEWGLPHGFRAVHHRGAHARGLAALGDGDFEEAYLELATITEPGVLQPGVPQAARSAIDLVEAAERSGRTAAARAHAAALGTAAPGVQLPPWAATVAAAVVAPARSAPGLFRRALAAEPLPPFPAARIELLLGERLRRSRSPVAAREPLESAATAFRRLGARSWAARAEAELRVAGGGAAASFGVLTPQEAKVASLAASGLTNRQIGARLFLSPRTVAAHLRHVFDKLGVRSRAALPAVLGRVEAPG